MNGGRDARRGRPRGGAPDTCHGRLPLTDATWRAFRKVVAQDVAPAKPQKPKEK